MAEKKEYVKLWMSYESYFEPYSDGEVGRLVLAMMKYRASGVEPEFNGNERYVWPAIKRDIDESLQAQEATATTNRENGKKGGRPPKGEKPNWFTENPKNPMGFEETEKKTKNPKKPIKIKNKDKEKDINKNTMCKSEADALFERVWKLYPQKRGKGKVSDANKRRLLDIGFDELSRAIDRYKADLALDDWRKPQNGSTFFNSGYIDYLDANYEKPERIQSEKTPGELNCQRDYDFDSLEQQLLQKQLGDEI